MLSRTVLTSMALVLTFAAFACTTEEPPPTPIADPSEKAEPAAEASAGQPKIAGESEFAFGKIAAGETVEHVFTIKNVGDADLVIDRVQKT